MFHTHSFTYHPRYIIFLSQYFSSPLSVPFHQCSIPIYSPTTYIMFFSQYFSFPCQYQSTNAPYPFVHLPPTLYNFSLPVLQFAPVSTIPPVLHTHSFTFHPHYIMFLSQYFSFPMSVPFHQRSIPIHSPSTHTIWCFSPSTSVFPCQYHSTNGPYPFIHPPPTLYGVSLPILQFSPVSTIPPMFHTYSFTYHPHYIMFLSHYFSFPLPVSFHHCSKLIFIYTMLLPEE